jgi:dynein heavy chain
MIAFENSFLNTWRSSIDEAKQGLKGYLLRRNDKQLSFEINVDERLVVLLEEIKWLSRMKIDIPESAKEVLAQVSPL